MRRAFRGFVIGFFGFVGFVLVGSTDLKAQEAVEDGVSAALKDRVGSLVERLDSKIAKERDDAEKSLIELGPRILPLLPESTRSAERDQRLERIRSTLRESNETASLAAAKVTIVRKGIRLSEVIRELQKQSNNTITDLREQMGEEATNPSVDLDIKETPFLEALDRVAEIAKVSFNFHTGDGSIGLTGAAPVKSKFTAYSGPFRVVLNQFASMRDYVTDTSSSNAVFEVVWEPRIRPMLMRLKGEDLKVLDDTGKAVEPRIMKESDETVLRPENPAAEVNIALNLPDRSAKTLKSMRVKTEVTIPAALKTFRFDDLTARKVKHKQGDIEVILESTEVDEQVWKIGVTVVFPGEGPAFESYRQGLFNNRIWLQKPDGSKFEHNGGFNNTASDGGRLGFEYLFVEAPGKPSDYTLVYETPSKVLTIPLEFEFKDVTLP